MKRILLLPSLLLFLTSCLIVGREAESTPEPIPPTQTSLTDRAIYKDGLAPEYRAVLNELPYASMYEIEFSITDDLAHINGSESVIYTNAEEIDLSEVRLRLFANILGGEMKVNNVAVNGKSFTPTYALNDSLMTVPLESPLKPKESLTLTMDFDFAVPQTVELNYGVQAYFDDVLALAHAYPVITVYDDEGWNAEVPPQSGDVTYADMSFFEITVEAPKGVTLVGSGREISRQENGDRQTVKYAAGPVRDFYLAASPEYEVFTKKVDGIELRFYTRDYLQDGAESALNVAAHAIEIFEERYAPYPYTELDFVSTPTSALGIEYPGMIAITEGIILPDHDYLEATVAHEVGHQWFYNLVGNDQLDDPWLDESITQFATLQYFSDTYGKAGAQGFRSSLEGRWEYVGKELIPVGLPVRDYNDAEYSGIVYGRGGLFFEALRDEMGMDNFDAFMKDYTQSNAWDIVTAEKLKQNAEKYCGCDLTRLFENWIYP
ncbi:Aminopeptidase N [Anaerolineales bacterium]|nr:Aminopeptidase N [Anaerolineales bacterium]